MKTQDTSSVDTPTYLMYTLDIPSVDTTYIFFRQYPG